MPCPRPPLFDSVVPAPCQEFVACRDHELKREAREALEKAWQEYGHLCPEGNEFVRRFQLEFLARSWELWLIAVLSASGLQLERPPPKGPDVLVRPSNGTRLWIEAVVPTPGGDGTADRVWQRPPGARGPFTGPRCEQVALRYLSALRDKLKKINDYRAEGIIADTDACLIALNQGAIIDGDLCDVEIPLLVRSVFGIGSPVLIIPVSEECKPYGHTPMIENFSKKNGAKVSATQFLDGTAAALSGVLFAAQVVWNLGWDASRTLRMVHNPLATVPLPRGTISTQCEMWVDTGILQHRGNCARFGIYGEGT